jgi:DNA modification methylase
MFKLYNDDCFNVLSKLKEKSINLFLLDLPYGQTACSWDSIIDLDKMWQQIKRTIKPNGQIVFFCTVKFGNALINSNPSWFRYDVIWEKKSKAVGFLSANKAPLRKHEMIYIFSDCDDDLQIERNLKLRAYAQKVKDYINKPRKEIDSKIGNLGIHHFFYIKSSQFGIPTKTNYDKLTKIYNLDKMENYIKYEEIKKQWDLENKKTYNPQKTKGKPYKVKAGKRKNPDVYGQRHVIDHSNISGDRHPTSIIKFNNPQKSDHPTQKPIDLLEWLIKTYSNENDLICDFTMGSGSTGVACKNTNRDFIGVELNKDYFDIAKKRIY